MTQRVDNRDSRFWVALLVCSALAAAACSDNGVSVQPSASRNVGFAARFVVSPTRATVGEVITFDASATNTAELPLRYNWSFGDGSLGGSESIAHIYHRPGNHEVVLTVTGPTGQQSTARQTVMIEAREPLAGNLGVDVEVRTLAGESLEGVRVEVEGFEVLAQTDAAGHARLEGLVTEHALLFRLHKQGFAPQFVRRTFPQAAYKPVLEAIMQPIDAVVVLPDPRLGGTVNAVQGARVTFPPNAIVDSAGKPVQEPVEVEFTLYGASRERLAAFPGGFEAVTNMGDAAVLVTHGAMDVTLRREDERLQLAAGASAVIEIPLQQDTFMPGMNIDLWSLDEFSGVWIQEGRGLVVVSEDAPNGLALQGTVTHFTVWNADTWASTPCKMEMELTCTRPDGRVRDVRDNDRVRGSVKLWTEPCSGYGKPCKQLAHLRSATADTYNPTGNRLEGVRCDKTTSPGNRVVDESLCKAANGRVPSDVRCKASAWGLYGSPIGVCTRKQENGDVCPDFMYCGPHRRDMPTYTGESSVVNPDGFCQPPFYRFSTVTLPSPGSCELVDGAGTASMFQNWQGWEGTTTATHETMTIPEMPRTKVKVRLRGLELGGTAYPNQDFEVNPDMPWGDACSRITLAQCEALPRECSQAPIKINIGPCPCDNPRAECCSDTPPSDCGPPPPCDHPRAECCSDNPPPDCCTGDPLPPGCDQEPNCAGPNPPAECCVGDPLPANCDPCNVPNPPGSCCVGDPLPERCERCTGPDRPADCPLDTVVLRCVSDAEYPGINDIPNACEVDGVFIERADGFTSRGITVVNSHVGGRGPSNAEILQTVDFTECSAESEVWKRYVEWFPNDLVLRFEEPLRDGDILRVYRQGFSASTTNANGEQCAVSGALDVFVDMGNRRENPVIRNQYNTFDVRFRDEHFQ